VDRSGRRRAALADGRVKLGIGLPNTMAHETDRRLMLDWARIADQAGFWALSTIDKPHYDSWEIPRGLEFLVSRNRLKVAISRARCLAYLVGSPRLLDVRCRTVEQMRLVNALCRFVELAEEQAA
jgi:hypothetical protein